MRLLDNIKAPLLHKTVRADMVVPRDLENQASELLRRFKTATAVLKDIYDITIYGQQHREVQILQLLEKLGAKTGSLLTRRELQKAIDQVNAMNKDSETLEVTLEYREVVVVRRAVRMWLSDIRRIPALARKQLSVTLAANFEGFVADLIRLIFRTNPDTLKSGKSTLKDEELVEALKSGNAMHILIEIRVRNIMYGSAFDWFSFLHKELGFEVKSTHDLEELFLVRNCVLHNNSNVSRELQAAEKNRYQSLGKPINVTERDIDRFINAARDDASAIYTEYCRKFCPSELTSSAGDDRQASSCRVQDRHRPKRTTGRNVRTESSSPKTRSTGSP